ncbi:MAG TPA: hypothetical protein VFN35_37065, partial [Ktedonobacteraceae bacterium]|nr:hypothetical protein [Ktedonobacteraceae bacterium]
MNQGACKYRQPGLVFSLLLLLLLSACGQPALSSPPPTPSGQLQTFPDTGPPGLPFYDPQGLCLDPQNNLYVADGSMDRS